MDSLEKQEFINKYFVPRRPSFLRSVLDGEQYLNR